MKKQKSLLWTVLSIAIAIGVWYFKDRGKNGGESSETFKEAELSGDVSKMLSSYKLSDRDFKVFENCNIVDHKWNDGDSFYVDYGEGRKHFRLYFVDTAESAYKEYGNGENNGERLDDQGEYFNGLNRDQTAELGVSAKKFVMNRLKEKSFKIVTKWEPVTNRKDETRIHAYVIFNFKEEERYLHEVLVAQGLVRIKTRGTKLPDGKSFYDQRDHLYAIEKLAKSYKLGAWNLN